MSVWFLKKSKRFSALLLITLAILATCITTILVVLHSPGPLKTSEQIIIKKGTSIKYTANMLVQKNVISSYNLFYLLSLFYELMGNKIKKGEYIFPDKVTPWQTLQIILSGKSLVHKLTVTEGMSVPNVIQILNDEPLLFGEIQDDVKEGYIMPDTYFFSYGDNRQKILSKMKLLMSEYLNARMSELNQASPLKSRIDVLILASIVEKEALLQSEKPLIASVFLNRLKKKLKLQADPTIIYGITEGKYQLKRSLTRSDVRKATPYNTYHIAGLPPSPICCPSRESIDAVIKPDKNDYLYFVVNGNGGHYFAKTYHEHKKYVKLYRIRQK
jgi:UPF0755 protein